MKYNLQNDLLTSEILYIFLSLGRKLRVISCKTILVLIKITWVNEQMRYSAHTHDHRLTNLHCITRKKFIYNKEQTAEVIMLLYFLKFLTGSSLIPIR